MEDGPGSAVVLPSGLGDSTRSVLGSHLEGPEGFGGGVWVGWWRSKGRISNMLHWAGEGGGEFEVELSSECLWM